MRNTHILSACLLFAAACGARTAPGGGHASVDAAADAGMDCQPFLTKTCDGGCPAGSYCIRQTDYSFEGETGCAPMPAACGGVPSCACMRSCVCKYLQPVYGCTEGPNSLHCDGPTSRRSAKRDVRYIGDTERAKLARDARSMRLATYHYKEEPNEAPPHLGFIIDDLPDSFAVTADGQHVDLYGYTSVLLATVQDQQQRIETLEKQVAALARR